MKSSVFFASSGERPLWELGLMPPRALPRAIGLKVLGLIMRNGRFGAHLILLET